MPSFNFDIGEKDRVGSRFVSDVRDELQRALAIEKSERKITQQQIAEKLGTSRAVINRQIMGLENMGIRRVAEILWAIGWKPNFEAQKIPAGENLNPPVEIAARGVKVEVSPPSTTGGTVIRPLRSAA
jgi:hypothetical protein